MHLDILAGQEYRSGGQVNRLVKYRPDTRGRRPPVEGAISDLPNILTGDKSSVNLGRFVPRVTRWGG